MQAQVAADVYELRVDEKVRILFSRSREAVLIIDIVWNHKLDIPIQRVSHFFYFFHLTKYLVFSLYLYFFCTSALDLTGMNLHYSFY